MSEMVVISHGHNYQEVTEAEYEAEWSEQGWALLTDQQYGRDALAYLAAVEASDLTAEEFGRQASAFRQAAEQT